MQVYRLINMFLITKFVVFSAALQEVLSTQDDLHSIYKKHLRYIETNAISPKKENSSQVIGVESQSGSFITTVYTTMTCQKNTEYTATGTTLGSCISASDTASYKYTSCNTQGSKTIVGMTSCTSGDCSSGCSSFDVPFDTGCQTMSMMTCSTQDEPWEEFSFDYHAL